MTTYTNIPAHINVTTRPKPRDKALVAAIGKDITGLGFDLLPSKTKNKPNKKIPINNNKKPAFPKDIFNGDIK